MKRWALLTVGLYAALILLMSTLVTYWLQPGADASEWWSFNAAFLTVLVLAQLVLLLVPVDLSRERPVPRRKILASAIVGGLLMGLLVGLFLFGVGIMIWKEEEVYSFGWLWLVLTGASWLVWGVWFYKSCRAGDPNVQISTISRWLLSGSILEMIVAIPSHIISRNRNDCCAPFATLVGIMMGLSVAVMSFGPGVFFLFAKRIRQKRIGRAS